MKKEDLASLLRLTGVDDNAVTLAMNAFDIGYEEAKYEAIKQSPIIKEVKKDGKDSTEVWTLDGNQGQEWDEVERQKVWSSKDTDAMDRILYGLGNG